MLAACAMAHICGGGAAVLDFISGVRRGVGVDGEPFDKARTITVTTARQFLMTPGPWSSTTGRLMRIRKTSRAVEAFLAGESISKLYEPKCELYPIERRRA